MYGVLLTLACIALVSACGIGSDGAVAIFAALKGHFALERLVIRGAPAFWLF